MSEAADILGSLIATSPDVGDAAAGVVERFTRNSMPKFASEGSTEFGDLSLEELLAVAEQHGITVESPEKVASEGGIDKVAADKAVITAQIAYHAFAQEVELAKQACLMGKCRYCKTNDVPAGGGTVCTTCQEA